MAGLPTPTATPTPSASGGVEVADWASILISSLALLFTMASFWWMNWRRGKLQAWMPRSYAGKGGVGSLTMQLPLVLFNTGPTPIVIRNLRLIFPKEENPPMPSFQATVPKLGTTENRDWATPLPVRGREALQIVAQFTDKKKGLIFKPKTYVVEVQAKLDQKEKWTTLLTWELKVTPSHLPQLNESFIAHDNELEA